MNFVIAGKDTTGAVLSWFFYMMCKHPDVQKKVMEEVDSATVGSILGLSMVDFAEQLPDVSSLPYLHAALNETLRLFPAVPVVQQILIETKYFCSCAELRNERCSFLFTG